MVLISERADPIIAKTIRALEPSLNELVIIGRCANALYRRCPASASGPEPIGTLDLDLACDPPIEVAGRSAINRSVLHDTKRNFEGHH